MTLFAAAAVVLASTPTSTPWRLGAVCEHMGNYTNGVRAQDMLRGKHLRVLNLGWAPFATVDASAPKGWTGMDVDLLNHYSWLLGFTWEMHDIGYPATTWTQHVIDYSYQGDLVGSFWVPSAERRDHMIQLRGHLDVSTILVTMRETPTRDESFSGIMRNSLWSWARPFSRGMWIMVIALILISGIVDWLAEVLNYPDHKLYSSLYEYCAGILWGGFEHPLSRASGIYQIVVAFVLLVLTASYTANLAAFITLSNAPALRATSIAQMDINKQPLCATAGGWTTRFGALYPRSNYQLFQGSSSSRDAATALRASGPNRQCDAVVTQRNYYDQWRTDGVNCQMEMAETLFSESGGWATNRNSECVQHALDYALYVLQTNGTVDQIYRSYSPIAACGTTSSSSTRRLHEPSTEPRMEGNMQAEMLANEDAEGGADGGAGVHGRRLSGHGAQGLAAMNLYDFGGVVFIWFIATVLVVLYTTGLRLQIFLNERRKKREARRAEALGRLGQNIKMTVMAPNYATGKKADKNGLLNALRVLAGHRAPKPVRDPECANEFGLKPGMNVDNESLMLREVLRQLGGLNRQIERFQSQTQMAEADARLNRATKTAGKMTNPTSTDAAPSAREAQMSWLQDAETVNDAAKVTSSSAMVEEP